MKSRIFVFLILAIIMIQYDAKAQLFAGGSYAYAQISESGRDDVRGFSFDLQGEFNLARENFVFIPTVRLAILDSKMYSPTNPFYIKNLSFSPLVTYRLIDFRGFSISPYGGPFVSKLQGRRAPSLLQPAAYIDDTRFGAEFGIEFRLKVYDYCTVKFNPINLLIGNEFFRQGNVNIMLSF